MIDKLPLLAGLPQAELDWLKAHGTEQVLADGDYFVREGEAGRFFYIVLEGELQVTRQVGGEAVVLGTTPPGVCTGETWLLLDTVAHVTARAIAPSCLLVFDQAEFRRIFSACPTTSKRIMQLAAERLADFQSTLRQHEKLTALGKLSAGLAHELSNPATAAQRATRSLAGLWPSVEALSLQLGAAGLGPDALERLAGLRQPAAPSADLTPVARGDRETALADWLAGRGAQHAWEHAPLFVAAGLEPATLEAALSPLPAEAVPLALDWLGATLAAADLVDQLGRSVERVNDLVAAVKAYSYRDQAPLQSVDINAGLEHTLAVLGPRLAGLTVTRQFAPALPTITARGAQLNQVWTHLIENAAEALNGHGEIQIVTRPENDYVMVEVTDNGPGIAPEHQARLFEPFFTTKGGGPAGGFGLTTVYRIVRQHRGIIEAHSQPGCTRFIVRLPIDLAGAEE